jgi:hypothetical protein
MDHLSETRSGLYNEVKSQNHSEGEFMVALRAKDIKLQEVRELLGFELIRQGRFESWLNLCPLELSEKAGLAAITAELFDYLEYDRISEGQMQLVAIAPLLRLAGYNRAPIEYRVEEDIGSIYIDDRDISIRGRFDIVAVNRSVQTDVQNLLWILVVESKNMGASEYVGIAQMLTYAYTSLARQESVWGLVTNGANYQFFYIQRGEKPTYCRMPSLNLLDVDPAEELLRVLKAIREWKPE